MDHSIFLMTFFVVIIARRECTLVFNLCCMKPLISEALESL